MKIGIMQPYFFPYLGYFQLINEVDRFVLYDDVNFIKGGWINRNFMLVNGEKKQFSIRLSGASSNRKINEIQVLEDGIYKNKLIKTLELSYRHAPFFSSVFPLLKQLLLQDEKNLAKYLEQCIRQICLYLGISTEIIISSDIHKDEEIAGQDRVLHICRCLNATKYVNAIGGINLYSKEAFAAAGMELDFLKMRSFRYQQFHQEFQPGLSIVDHMMFLDPFQIKSYLSEFELS